MAGLSQIATQPDEASKPSNQELARLFNDMKSGRQLTEAQHDMLEKALSVAAKREPAMVAQVAFQQEVYSGPLPHCDQLNGYDEETRRAIVAMAVREQEHAHLMNHTGLTGAISKDRRAQYCAVTVAVTGLLAAGWIAQFSAVASAIIGGLDLVTLVGIFLVPRLAVKRVEEAEQKKPPQQQDKKRPRRK